MAFAFPDLKRPQYPSSPEVLLSALAWSVIPRASGHNETGLIYQRKESRAKRGVAIEQTMPRGQGLEDFRASLQSNGWMTADGGDLPRVVAEAAADAMLGVKPPKGVGYASSAIGLAGALLQDPTGSLAAKNPPNFANLLNTMYALGGSTEGKTAASLWFDVARHYSATGILKTLDGALAGTALERFLPDGVWPPAAPQIAKASVPEPAPPWWLEDVVSAGIGTPFSWFHASWNRLCSQEWYTILPPRRWAGWAVCILRNAIGFTFLWEANFFLQLARGIADHERDPTTVARWALSPTRPLVPYQRGGIAQMDVMPSIRRLLTQGLACRKAIIEATRELDEEPNNLASLIEALRATQPKSIQAALGGGGEKGGLSNLIETVRYSLLARSALDMPDHYALLKVVSRNYTHVAPAPEWIVVMSAMAATGPSDVVRLGDVQRSLEDIGFKPRIDFLLGELERAGLCASASDGDEGIEINLGFGRK
jgi:hypothetical protein